MSTLIVALVLLFASATFSVTTVYADSGYVEVADGLEIGGRIDIAKIYWKYDESNLYLKVEYDGNHTVYTSLGGAFYIDSDMNASTGDSLRGLGADYEVDWDRNTSGSLVNDFYAWNSTREGWDYVKDLSMSSNGSWLEVTVPLVDIGSPTSGVRFYLSSWNYLYDWIHATATYDKGTPVTITVDGNPSDWMGITPLLTDTSGDSDQEYGTILIYLTNDNDKLYVRQETQAPPNTTLPPSSSGSYVQERIRLYFDTDKNASTGDPTGSIGADYRTDHFFYRYTSSISAYVSAYQWGSWIGIDETDKGAVSTTREWSILLSDLDLDSVSSFDVYATYGHVYHPDPVPDQGIITALQPGAPQPFSMIDGDVLEAGEGEAYFIYADPYRMERAVAAYDVTAGGIVYGLCQEHQNQNFDSYVGWVSQEESDKGRLILEDKAVLMFGSHWPHWCVDYLQSQGLTPVDFVEDWGAEQFKMIDHETSEVLTTVNYNTHDFEHDDYFVLMACADENSNVCFIIYGFDWKGTWAAGIQLKTMAENIETYTEPYYVYHWVDAGEMDGIPQTNEFTLVT